MEPAPTHTPIGPDAPRYGFFQLLRLLAARRPGAPGPGYGYDYRAEPVRVRPDPSNVFPPSDVRSVERENDPAQPPVVTVTFGGLYGIDAPMPFAFHQRIAADTESAATLRSFLDLFSHRFYTLLWRAWARYRPELFAEHAEIRKTHERRVRALSGIGSSGAARPPVSEGVLLELAGRMAAWSRNAEGLQVLLERALELPVTIYENVARRVELPHRPRIGASRLGRDTVVGNRVWDASGHFRVEVGPLSLDQFLDLLPGQEGARRVDALVRLYAPDYLDYDLDLVLDSAAVPPLRLGESRSARLGLTACVGRPRTPHVNRTVRYAA